MNRALLVAAAWMCAVLAWSQCAFASNAALDVSQYVHTAWRTRDGFTKGKITSIAQTPDGYLWLGTELGLLRFDGVRTVPWQPPPNQRLASNAIRSLLAARDGTLWIGTEDGLASWKDGHLVQSEALDGSYISKVLEDREGTIWTLRYRNNWAICSIQQGRVTCSGEDGGAGADALGLYEDSRGTLWVGVRDGVWRWRPDPRMFYRLPPEPNGIQGLSEADDGALLIAKVGGIRRFVDGRVVTESPFPPSMRSEQARPLFRDREGGLWIGTATRGLIHVHQGITDTFGQTDGLSGDDIAAIFEDREGNVWVATNGGLDRFRDAAVVSYSESQGLANKPVQSVLASTDGSVWVGTFSGLSRWTRGHVTTYRGMGGVQSLFEDHQRRVWVSTARGVGYLENDRLVLVKSLPGGVTRAIVEDGRKTLWVVNPELGLFHVDPRQLEDVEHIPRSALRHDDVVNAVAADPSGEGVWLGFFRGGISYVAGGQVRAAYASSDGLAEGRISGLYAEPGGTLWIAADGGLTRLKGGRMTTLTSRNGLPCDAVGWVIADASGSLWLGMACGLVRIARPDIEAWSGGNGTIPTTMFDQTDGVRTFVSATYYTASVGRSPDGKLWFVSQDGLSVVDPSRLPVNTLPPAVHIEQVLADRQAYPAASTVGESIQLPPLIRDLQIDYTALSLVAPERVRFRYKLEGRDADWQEAGGRRQAFYNDLRPGNYRFRVVASNNSGVWNETGALLDFSVAPAYYQTSWFLALSVASVIALAWTAHRIRLRIVEKHRHEIGALNERMMKAQEQERIRIAGELHDGVMQEMLAATMILGTAKRRIPNNPDANAALDKVQQKLIQAGTDLRQLSHDLHPPLLQEAGLPKAVQGYCEQFSGACAIPVSCEADETVGELSRGAALALFRIVQEALGNVAKHAHARHITVRLARSGNLVSLTVSDDGAGIDRERLASGGGLGLVMMRERASQLNGRFEFDSAPGRGTTISVMIPFR